ncbi:MAG: hypothetical protein IT424_07130 [Pirellulales bacterium]|nr:hypothetical protein [Pirellulales bacterium]
MNKLLVAVLLLLHIEAPWPAAAALFDPAAPIRQWTEFQAEGYSAPVSAIVFSDRDELCAGMPLGGVGTGCLDVETTGVLGFSSVFFPSLMLEPTPYQTLRNAQLLTPFLGISVGKDVWVLASEKMLQGGEFRGCVDPVDPGEYTKNETYMNHWRVSVPKTEGVKPAKSIRYWGHYPIVDVDYQTDAPVAVSLRAWSTFLPGDAKASATPGAVFEVRLENLTEQVQAGMVAFNFPGAHSNEAGGDRFVRSQSKADNWQALAGEASRAKYALAVVDEPDVEFGGNLSVGGGAWSSIHQGLPAAHQQDAGASAGVKYSLKPKQRKTVRFLLAWHVRDWQGGAYDEIKHFDETWVQNDFTLSKTDRFARSTYRPQYGEWFQGPIDVVRQLAASHQSRLARIIAWQEAIYADKSLPVWLRAALVDSLSQFAEDSVWAAPAAELSSWAAPVGAFQLVECPRTCSVMGCIASNYYGDLPVTYFFPELERQILRGYAAYMRPDGAVPFLYPPNDFTRPAFEWQIGLNGACFADLVHRLWLRTGDRSVLEEFYPAVKKNLEFTAGLADGEPGLISFHREGKGQEWWEHTPVYGMVTHLAGVRMAQIRFARSMAERLGDVDFARRCRQWLAEAQKLTEENLWNEQTRSYDFFNYPAKGMKSPDIMSSQLDGQWMADFHGQEPVFRNDRIAAALETVKDTCLVDMGVAGFAEPGKGPDLERYGTFPPEVIIVAMTYIYRGDRELGLEIARRSTDNIVRVQGLGWDLPNLIRCDTGARTYGADYYQNMILWGLPASLAGGDLTQPCQRGGLVDRVLRAAGGAQQ